MSYQAFIWHGHAKNPGWLSISRSTPTGGLARAFARHYLVGLQLSELITGHWQFPTREVTLAVIPYTDVGWITAEDLGRCVDDHTATVWTMMVPKVDVSSTGDVSDAISTDTVGTVGSKVLYWTHEETSRSYRIVANDHGRFVHHEDGTCLLDVDLHEARRIGLVSTIDRVETSDEP